MNILKHKGIWAGTVLFALFLAQMYAFEPAKRKRVDDKIHFTSNRLYHDVAIDPNGDILVGKVHITHDGMVLTCDSAVVYENSNSFLAYGKVHMVQGDTLSLNGDSLFYDGGQEIARIFDNVVMKHGTMRLYTDILNFNREENRGFYDVGGKLVDGKMVLTSRNGEYFTDTKQANFDNDVLLVNNKKDTIVTNELHYNTDDKWAHAVGPTNIYSGSSRIYTEDGYYNSGSGVARMYDRPQLFNQGRKLIGDSLHYDKESKFSEAFGNIEFFDPKNKSIMCGNYGWYDEAKGEAMCTDRALAKDFSNEQDTLFIHGDTLRLYTFNQKTDSAYRELYGFYHVRAFRSDLQMVCDSLRYSSKDSCMSLHKDPIVWSDGRQILGEIINVYTNDSTIDSVYVDQQALMIEQLSDSTLYDQIGGSLMRAYFDNGELKEFWVDGNGTIINHPMEKDSTYLYMNYIEAAKIRAYMENKRLRKMVGFPGVQGTDYPLNMAPPEKIRLKGFAWFDWIRPKDKDDLFDWRSKGEANKLKAIPRRNVPLQTLTRLSKKGEEAIKNHSEEIQEKVTEALDDADLEVKVEEATQETPLPEESVIQQTEESTTQN